VRRRNIHQGGRPTMRCPLIGHTMWATKRRPGLPGGEVTSQVSNLEESLERDPNPAGLGRRGWAMQYPPLGAVVVTMLLAVLALPSSLNLPQSNPSTVLEYAPVPPEDESPTQQVEGAISSLGLGSSSSLSTDPPAAELGPSLTKAEEATVKKCVGNPPRQSEDPNAPPCQPFFEGDNGGKTWQGVTRDEVTVLIYHSSFISDQNETEGGDTSAGEGTPTGQYCDLGRPSSEQTGCRDGNTGNELSLVAAGRALAKYFNSRYQTYNRYVRIYFYWGSASTASGRKAHARANWEALKPFAVLDRATFGGFNEAYAESMAQRRTMVFGSFGELDASFFRRLAPMAYSFWPDVEHWADLYTSYVCQKVVPYKVSNAGGPDKDGQPMNGQDRRYGLMYTSDSSHPGLQYFKKLVEQGIKKCGANVVAEVDFPYAGANIDNRCAPDCTFAVQNVAEMRDAKVNTVLWLGGMESRTTDAADKSGWYPEWVVAGDRVIDDLLNGRAQNQRVWRHAWVVSQQLKESRFEESPARQAFREAEPRGRRIHEYWATTLYREYFALFKAIQVAGPYLSPETVDQGQHSIPRQSSTDARVAACFYDPGDYSCVKDSHEAWWDPDAPDPNGEQGVQGCYRMVRGGKRYLAGTWEGGHDVFGNPNDAPCNGVKGASHNYPA